MFSESHCHLGSITLESVRKAEEIGFELLLDAGIDAQSCESAVKISGKHSIVRACVGIHPWYANEYGDYAKGLIRGLAAHPKVVAISEIGLDFIGRMTKEWVREDRFIDPNIQRETLSAQLALAEDLALPVLVHDRAPGQEILDILENTGAAKRGAAIHGFNKDSAYVERCEKLGVYLSVGRSIVRDPSSEFLEAVKHIPLNLLLTETDSGNPENLLPVCDAIARIKGLTLDRVGAQATLNLKKLIGA